MSYRSVTYVDTEDVDPLLRSVDPGVPRNSEESSSGERLDEDTPPKRTPPDKTVHGKPREKP